MFKKIAFLVVISAIVPGLARAACSRANLTRCLDSACAINLSTNPAARCQYCGTANAGEPPIDNGIKSVSVGTSTKYNIPAKELKSAPTDPGARYVWATNRCIELVAGCTPDDVSDTYDTLIEQSCTAAGISAQMETLKSKATKTKTKTTCSAEISGCMTSDAKCGFDFGACGFDTEFSRFFSACMAENAGCDEYATEIRADLTISRDSAIKNTENAIESIVKAHQDARAKRENSPRATCENNSGREKCISRMCKERMPNNCADGHDDEVNMATQLCKFYDTACGTLK